MSKEEAIEILSDMRCECNLFEDEEEATRYHALSWAINSMNNEPKHGHWIPSDKGDCIYTCSECGFIRDAYILEEKAYCPRCGADMQEVGK
jgi:rubrerythrin